MTIHRIVSSPFKYVCLHDFDAANATPRGKAGDVMTMLSHILKPKKTEITGFAGGFFFLIF